MTRIFVGFDGVLNVAKTPNHPIDGFRLDPEMVRRLNTLVQRLDAKVVISSHWRHFVSLTKIRAALHRRGLTHARTVVIGVTPDMTPMDARAPYHRGPEIEAWCRLHQVPPRRIVVLDAGGLGLGWPIRRLVQTSADVGFTDADIERAVALFGRTV